MALIKVRKIATGEIGQLPEENFNPDKYETLTRDSYIQELQKSGIGEATINQRLRESGEKAYSQPLEEKISTKTGLFNIPVLGGALRSIVNPTEKYGRMVGGAGYEALRAGQAAMGRNDVYVNPETGQDVPNPFLPQDELAQLSGPNGDQEGLKRVFDMMGTAATVYSLPGMVRSIPKILQPGKTMGQLLEKKVASVPEPWRAINKPENLIENISKNKNLTGIAPEEVQKVLGPEVQKLWPSTFAPGTKTAFIRDMAATSPVDITDLHNTMKTINKFYGNPFFNKIQSIFGQAGTADKTRIMVQFGEEIRPLIEQYAKLGGQDITGLNKILSMYYKGRKVAVTGGGLFGIMRLLGNILGSGGNSTTNYISSGVGE